LVTGNENIVSGAGAQIDHGISGTDFGELGGESAAEAKALAIAELAKLT
jgi:hypothetical protein